MASTFMGISIANRGLAASQAGLAVTTNNMSNINTNGYSRQVVNQIEIGPAAVYSSNLVGAGVEVTSIDSVRSFRLDQKYWQENSALGEWDAKSTYLKEIETVFGSTDDNTISTALDSFSAALEDLSTDPSSSSARAVVLETGVEACEAFNDASSQLTQLRGDINNEVKTTVDQINSYASQIADLNQQITVAKASGASSNELEDQRGVLTDKLSSLVGITVTKTDSGAYNIAIGDSVLVSGSKANQLECYTVTDNNSEQNGMYGIRWANSGEELTAGGTGSLTGYLELRDGSEAGNKGIPYYINQLNEMARTVAEAFNEGVYEDSTVDSGYSGHAGGAGLDGSTGIRFFSYNGLSSAELMAGGADTDAVYANITAANISVSKDIQDDTNKIAAASADGEDGNNENADDLISILADKNMFKTGTANDFYDTIIATVGTASSYAKTVYSRKDSITSYIESSRSSVSGVSSDEETVNLTKYQTAYAASSEMVTAWNKIYEETINMVSD